jgi:hypothetical protein
MAQGWLTDENPFQEWLALIARQLERFSEQLLRLAPACPWGRRLDAVLESEGDSAPQSHVWSVVNAPAETAYRGDVDPAAPR